MNLATVINVDMFLPYFREAKHMYKVCSNLVTDNLKNHSLLAKTFLRSRNTYIMVNLKMFGPNNHHKVIVSKA